LQLSELKQKTLVFKKEVYANPQAAYALALIVESLLNVIFNASVPPDTNLDPPPVGGDCQRGAALYHSG